MLNGIPLQHTLPPQIFPKILRFKKFTITLSKAKLEKAIRVFIAFLRFLPGCLLDAGAYLIFQRLRIIIIFDMQVHGANKLFLRYFFLKKYNKKLLNNIK